MSVGALLLGLLVVWPRIKQLRAGSASISDRLTALELAAGELRFALAGIVTALIGGVLLLVGEIT